MDLVSKTVILSNSENVISPFVDERKDTHRSLVPIDNEMHFVITGTHLPSWHTERLACLKSVWLKVRSPEERPLACGKSPQKVARSFRTPQVHRNMVSTSFVLPRHAYAHSLSRMRILPSTRQNPNLSRSEVRMMTNSGAPIFSAVNGPCASAYSASSHALNSCAVTGDISASFSMATFYLGASQSVCRAIANMQDMRTIARMRSGRLHLGTASRQRNFCAEPVIIRPAAACESCLRQHRFDLGGVAYRLATATPAPPLTNVAPNRGYEYRHFIQKFESQEPQTQNSVQPIHRQITSLQRRRCCRFAGLTPLTLLHYSCSEAIYQTYVRVLTTMCPQESSTVAEPQYITKMPRENPRLSEALLVGKTILFISHAGPTIQFNRNTNTCSLFRKAA